MTLRYNVCLFAVKFIEDHDIKLDRAELLSLSIVACKAYLLEFNLIGLPSNFPSFSV